MASEAGAYLKRVRRNKGYSLAEVAGKLQSTDSRISRIEEGNVAEPSPLLIKQMSELYQIDLLDLLLRFGYIDSKNISILNGLKNADRLTAEQLEAVQKHINSYLDE